MKAVSILFVTLVAAINCAPQPETDNVQVAQINDEQAANYINLIINRLEKDASSSESVDNQIVKFVIHGIDKKCVLSHYKKYNAVNLASELNKLMEEDEQRDVNEEKTPEEKAKAHFPVLAALLFGIPCNKNFDAYLEYFFENIMTFQVLYKAFADEPEFKEYIDYVTCANAYAIDHKYIDSHEHTYITEVANTEVCESNKEMAKQIVDGTVEEVLSSFKVTTNKECYKKALLKIESFVLHYVLLIQVELTDVQRIQERTNFIKDFHDIVDGIAHCYATSSNEV